MCSITLFLSRQAIPQHPGLGFITELELNRCSKGYLVTCYSPKTLLTKNNLLLRLTCALPAWRFHMVRNGTNQPWKDDFYLKLIIPSSSDGLWMLFLLPLADLHPMWLYSSELLDYTLFVDTILDVQHIHKESGGDLWCEDRKSVV